MPLALRSLIAALIVGLCLGISQGTVAQPSPPDSPTPPGAKTRSDTVDFSPTGKVELDNRSGSITVSTWDRPQVGYVVTLVPSERDSILGADFDIDHSEEEFSVGHDHSWSIRIPGLLTISPDGTSEPTGHFRIVMPKTASLEINDYGSTIEVSGVEGPTDIGTHDGTVRVRGGDGKLHLETYSGAVTATGLREEADLETYSGRMTAVFEEFSASSSAETYSGPLRFYLPSDTGFVLETEADSSQVTIDEAFGTPSRDDDRWTFNGGGPDLSVETFSGTIELHPLDAYSPSAR